MINFFDTVYTSIHNKSNPFARYLLYPLLRIPTLYLANALLPIYFRWSAANPKYRIETSKSKSPQTIVSLTSFPARIRGVWMVIESILRQEVKPDRILLWLSRDQFPSLESLPKNLLRLQERGLEIRLCEGDLKAHKKYIYALREFPNDTLITVDDDTIYHTRLLQYLIELHMQYPQAICSTRCRRIETINGDLTPYNTWHKVERETAPSFALFPTGVGGVLYPSGSLYGDVLEEALFQKLCPHADDVWLNVMSHLEGTACAKTAYTSHGLPILFRDKTRLTTQNVGRNANDVQIHNLRDHYRHTLGRDPYGMLLHPAKEE